MTYMGMIGSTLGTIGAFALGYYKGNAVADGNPLPTGIDIAITYGTPIAGALVGMGFGKWEAMDCGGSLADITPMILPIAGTVAGGAVGLIAQGIGYIAGSTLGKYI